jgi:uncharacterized cupredoxin-like copper-binding protein
MRLLKDFLSICFSWPLTLVFTLTCSLAPVSAQNADHAHDHSQHATSSASAKPQTVQRTVAITMDDNMRFIPDHIDVKQGETVEFKVRNLGKLHHEMTLGTDKALKAHAEMMQKHPDMAHTDEGMVSVAPGAEATLKYHFGQSGKLNFVCLQLGHAEAGMKGDIKIKAN